MSSARLSPLDIDDLDAEARSFVQPIYDKADTRNILLTLARHPALLRRWMPITRYTFDGSGLDSADSELICLRTSWLCDAAYEFTHHAKLALHRGLSAEQINSIVKGAQADCFDSRQKVLLSAVDQLVANKTIDEALWNELCAHYDQNQVMDIVFSCGNYYIIALVQGALRVELEDTTELHPAFRG